MSEDILTSAAAFVEGGIQDACDDACSICLEEFSDSDPSTVRILHIYLVLPWTECASAWSIIKSFNLQVTGCKHEFHLQCILEW